MNLGVFDCHVALGSSTSCRIHREDTIQFVAGVLPGIFTSGGAIVWVVDQIATQDSQGNNIAKQFRSAGQNRVFAKLTAS